MNRILTVVAILILIGLGAYFLWGGDEEQALQQKSTAPSTEKTDGVNAPATDALKREQKVPAVASEPKREAANDTPVSKSADAAPATTEKKSGKQPAKEAAAVTRKAEKAKKDKEALTRAAEKAAESAGKAADRKAAQAAKAAAEREAAAKAAAEAAEAEKLAREAGVPIEQNPMMAEALSQIEIDQEIPVELYQAVAVLIGFIMRTGKAQHPPGA